MRMTFDFVSQLAQLDTHLRSNVPVTASGCHCQILKAALSYLGVTKLPTPYHSQTIVAGDISPYMTGTLKH